MILVTGHRGFIGGKLYRKLNDIGFEVIGIDLKEGTDILHTLPTSKVDVVFHMAAFPSVQYSVENPSYTLMHNVLGTSRLLEWSKRTGVKRFIFSSSAAAYGNDGTIVSPYALHKRLSEQECRLYSDLYGLETVCLRYFNAYSEDQPYGGAYSTVISAWIEKLRNNEPLQIDGDGLQTRDFIHVDDVVGANIFCATSNNIFKGNIYDVATGINTSIKQLKEFVDSRYNITWLNAPARLGDIKESKANIIPLQNLGWEAQVDITTGLNNCFGEKNEIN